MQDPLVPPDCDLRDFQWMPVDIIRLFGSTFHAQTNDSEWRAGVTLWLKSYHQVPAASLPDDDAALAMLAELGRDQKSWKRLRVKALHGWTQCSDGRLYHKTVAEKALEAWIDKLLQRKSSAAGNAKRWGGDASLPGIESAIETATEMLRALNPNSKTLAKRTKKGTQAEGNGNAANAPQDQQRDRDGSPGVVPSGSQENRTEQNGLKKEDDHQPLKPLALDVSDDEQFEYEVLLDKLCTAAGVVPDQRFPALQVTGPITDMIDAGWSLEKHILPKIREMRLKGKSGASWEYYATAIRKGADKPPKVAPPPAALVEATSETFLQRRQREWRQQLAAWKQYGTWSDQWGSAPGSSSCQIPPEFVAEFERQHANGAAA